jgi:hypothetical protein
MNLGRRDRRAARHASTCQKARMPPAFGGDGRVEHQLHYHEHGITRVDTDRRRNLFVTVRDEIIRLLPPPRRQQPAPDWSAVREYLGSDLPSGYKWFCETYGTGALRAGGFDRILFAHPNEQLDGSNSIVWTMESKRERLLDRRGRAASDSSCGVAYPIFPEPGGLVAFASSPDDFEFYFKAEATADPDTWPVVWHDFAAYDETRWHEFPASFEQFILDLGSGTAPTEITGEDEGVRYDEYVPYGEFSPAEQD